MALEGERHRASLHLPSLLVFFLSPFVLSYLPPGNQGSSFPFLFTLQTLLAPQTGSMTSPSCPS